MIQINFASHDGADIFAANPQHTLAGMESSTPRAFAGNFLFLGTSTISETTCLVVDVDTLDDPSKDLISGTTRKVVTFRNTGAPQKTKQKCLTPDGAGVVETWCPTTITYRIKLDSGEVKEYVPHVCDFEGTTP